ncbi:unnamed protein product, partial [marine sediment metagenome]
MVVGVFADFLEVVVFAAYPQAFLAVDRPRRLWGRQAQKYIIRANSGL